MRYQVFVAEDESRIREGIRSHLERTGRYLLCGEAADGEMALSAILELKPDILITDIRMPFMDGLALSRAVKRAIPRTKIVIISGHDEFEYAQQAISIGVDEYLLKPLSSKSLLETLDKTADRIEEERSRLADIHRDRMRKRQTMLQLRDGFFDELLTGALSTAQALEQAEEFDLSLPARLYLAAEMELSYEKAAPEAPLQVRALIDRLLEEREDALWCLRGRDRVVLIAKGDSQEAVEHTVYEIALAVGDELSHMLKVSATTCIGRVTERIAEIAASYQSAHTLMRSLPGLPKGAVINCADLDRDQLLQMTSSIDEPMARKLRYAGEQDIGPILDHIFGSADSSDVGSFLYTNYRFTDFLVTASRMVKEAGGDSAQVFPQLSQINPILQSGNLERLRELARRMLEGLIAFQGDSTGGPKYGDCIAKAKEYIGEHFGSSDISLNTVASYVGFSPNHFSTVFSQNTGETFIGYLTRVRMEQARQLLLSTDLPSGEIAFRTGYSDTNYFRYLFKKHYGQSPRELKQSQEP